MYYPKFQRERDTWMLERDISQFFAKPLAHSCSMRLRTSKGVIQMYPILLLKVDVASGFQTTLLDPFLTPSALEHTLGAIDATRSFAYLLHPTAELESPVHLQFAVICTTNAGQRQLRILNLCLQTSSMASNVFRFADLDTTLILWLRKLLCRRDNEEQAIRDGITCQCTNLLLAYRQLCGLSSPSSQVR